MSAEGVALESASAAGAALESAAGVTPESASAESVAPESASAAGAALESAAGVTPESASAAGVALESASAAGAALESAAGVTPESASAEDVAPASAERAASAKRAAPAFTRLLAHARPHARVLALGGVLTLAGSGAALGMPLMAKYAIQAFAEHRSPAPALLLLTLAVLVGAALTATGGYLMCRTGEAVVLGARERLVARVLHLNVASVDRLSPGDLLTRATGDTTLLRTVLSRSLVESASGALGLLGTVVLMGIMDAVLLGVTLLALAAIGAALALLTPRIRRAQTAAQDAVGAMGSRLDRALQSFRTVKANGAEDRERAAVTAAARHAHDKGLAVARWTSASDVATGGAVQLAFLCVLGVGGARVASGALDIASLIAFLLYLFSLVGPLGQLTEGWIGLNNGMAAVTRLTEIENLPGETPQPAGRAGELGAAPIRSGVTFTDVAFRYAAATDGDDDTRPPAHDGVTFAAPPHGLTALVGPSGAGKSTVFALLERFYDHESGSITVDGRDIRDWPLAELRAALGYVEQDAPVLAGTLRENLRYAAPDASDEELREALARTRLDELVGRLPDGLDTPVGHRGVLLSGGERQRVAIARALLRHPRILLLDEVTSHLDAVNEQHLREVIRDLAAHTTVLVIAHRLSTVVDADTIVVLEHGRVRAQGSHLDLLERDSLYAELAATQLVAAITHR
ncbi:MULTISPECIES: ABC transporter ATP-binding protein [unclassified Streptomyces]|uniref:ABC transporter ATP-binding protein n=1 Tax=unclassified Streptomyces TaxID=2593676 RepID=UPI00278BB236|nr:MULTISPECIES: ABC transporter ATP-binding protein [unclassified Streptomyces]